MTKLPSSLVTIAYKDEHRDTDVCCDSSSVTEETSGNSESTSTSITNARFHRKSSPSVEEKRKSVRLWLDADAATKDSDRNTVVVQIGQVETFQAEEISSNDLYICEDTFSVTSSRPASPNRFSKLREQQPSISDGHFDFDPRFEVIKSEVMREIETKDDPRMYKTHSLIQYWKRQEEGLSVTEEVSNIEKVIEVDENLNENTVKKRLAFRKAKPVSVRKSLKLRNKSEDENKDLQTKRKKSFFNKEKQKILTKNHSVGNYLLPKTPIERKNSWGSIKEALSGITSPIMRRKAPYEEIFNGIESGNSSMEKNVLHGDIPKYKIGEVQEKFPNDRLDLDLSLDEQDSKLSRRFHHVLSYSPRLYKRLNSNLASDIETQKHSNDDLNHSGNNSPSSPMRRLYVQEGHVKLTYMGSTNERFMFLFNDLLLVAKPKSATTFKLKEKVRVSEIWLSTTIDDVAETALPPEKCFTIGWPTVNYVAGFNTPEEKDLWYKTLQKCRDEQQERLELKEVTVNVINKINQEDSYSIQTATLTVTVKHDAKAVVKMAQEQFQIQPDEHSLYQLWLATKEIPCPLLGHEIPYSIKVYHSRLRDSLRDESDAVDFDTSCQFYLRKSKQTGNRMSLDLINNQKKWKNPMKKSPIYNWAMNKKTSKYSSSQYPHDASGPGKLFGLPLTSLSNEEELIPKPIQNILVQLFRRGPGTTGIFRKSALQRTAKQIRQNLDTGRDENMDGTSVIVLAAVLKDFFRSMPDSLISSTLYENLVGTKLTTNVETRIDEIKKILLLLPKENYELTMKFICVLHHIQRFSERNNMNSYNLSICVSQSIMWPPSSSRMEATEQTSRTSDFVCFLIDNFVTTFGSENEYILGNEAEIQFTDGPGEDSDSGTDQPIYRLRQDETDWEKYDSEKEIELPNTPVESVFSPTKSNLDSPFALSDSSICTIDSDDVKRNSVSLAAGSALKPTLQANIKREFDEIGRGDASDHENTDFNEIFQRNLLRHPKHKRVLSSTTTSAELIEHKRNLKIEDHDSERKTEFSSKDPKDINFRDSIKQNSEIVPKKYIISHPVIKHFSTEYSAAPNTVFHSVDRRRQPAAPSYEEHIQRTQAKHRIIKPEVRKKSIPPHQIQQLNVENYIPPTPQSNKTCNTNHDVIFSKDDNKNLSDPVKNSDHCENTPLKSANLTFTSIDPDSTHVRPVGIESLIATFQQYSSTAEPSAFSKKVLRQGNIDRVAEASKSSQHDKHDEKMTENNDFENTHHLNESLSITKTCEEDPQSTESFYLHSKEEKIITTDLPIPKLITTPKKRYLASAQNYIDSNDRPTNGVHSEEIDLISSDKSVKNRTFSDMKKDNENTALSSSQISKNGKIRLNSVESFERLSPVFIKDNLYQQPSQFNNPFSLKLKSDYKQSPPNTCDVRSQSLQVKKTCLTQAPKKIDQLTNCNVIKENQSKIITARELRRTNRRLKKEIRNAFNEGNFVYKYSNDGHKPSSEVSNGLCCYKQPHWKSDNESMFNAFGCGDNNNRIITSHTGSLPQDESCV